MSFDTFDEGINLGGIRNKTEVRILICYLFASVKENMSKETVLDALLEKGLANYFEASSCFDELVNKKNLEQVENSNLFRATENTYMISEQLENTLALTVKERAYECAMSLLQQEKAEKENKVTIDKLSNGYNITCSISGGDISLMDISLYLADSDQAMIVKKNFHSNPQLVYKVLLALMTRNKELIKDALNELL